MTDARTSDAFAREPLLDVRSVGVAVKSATLVSNVDLQVGPGDWLSIIGPNGAGKSTLLKAIATGAPSAGEVYINGANIADLTTSERAALVSWVPQYPTIPGGMTVLDYILLGRTPHLHPLASPRREDIELAEAILDDLQLSPFATRLVETLSGGERQRAVIGRALVQESPLMLLDEPTSALDLGHQQEVLALLDRLRAEGERTIITTMHDLTLAGAFADELVMMSDGSVAHRGSARSVLTEKNIADHYGAEVRVEVVDGTVVVVPRLSPAPTISPTSEQE